MMLAMVLTLLLAPAEPVTIYVGPNAHDGFVDTDKGVLDSIADIQGQLRKDRAFHVVTVPESADLQLFVVRRGYGDAAGGVGVPIGALTFYLPIRARFVETSLHAGTYERAFVGEDHTHDHWGPCAKMIAKDLSVWVAANRERIAGMK
jgi:hypothetical protein